MSEAWYTPFGMTLAVEAAPEVLAFVQHTLEPWRSAEALADSAGVLRLTVELRETLPAGAPVLPSLQRLGAWTVGHAAAGVLAVHGDHGVVALHPADAEHLAAWVETAVAVLAQARGLQIVAGASVACGSRALLLLGAGATALAQACPPPLRVLAAPQSYIRPAQPPQVWPWPAGYAHPEGPVALAAICCLDRAPGSASSLERVEPFVAAAILESLRSDAALAHMSRLFRVRVGTDLGRAATLLEGLLS